MYFITSKIAVLKGLKGNCLEVVMVTRETASTAISNIRISFQ
jgi:hypothetical protein